MELEVVAVINERLDLPALAIVADANDRDLGLLDHCYQCGDATSVARSAAINLVHDNDALLFVVSSKRHDRWVG